MKNYIYDKLRHSIYLVGHDLKEFDKFRSVMTKRAIEEKCKKIADEGFNCVHPSIAHFRWEFHHYFDELVDFSKRLTDTAHKYGLNVIEHHSSVLVKKDYFDGFKYKSWNLQKMLKEDMRTGKNYIYPPNYLVFCCSNPEFQEAYFDLAKKFVIDVPVDLFMPDDAGWSNDYYNCGCKYCRELFQSRTGYEMPQTGHLDKNFYENRENPAWNAWVRFRSTKVAIFLSKIKEFLISQGRPELAITTCNSDTLTTLTGRIQGTDHQEYDQIGNLDFGYNEVYCRESITYNWNRIFIDQYTNSEIGQYCNIPYLSHPYPRFNEEGVLSASIASCLGMGLITPTSENIYLDNEYININNFIEQNKYAIYESRHLANAGVVFSRNTRDFYGEDIFVRTNIETHCDEFAGWCENIMKTNLPYRILIDSFIETEDLSNFDVIILPNCACMSNIMIEKISEYVSNGGTLIATNETSLFDNNGNKLKNFKLSEIFGFDYLTTVKGHNYPVVQNFCKKGDSINYNQSTFKIDQYDEELRDSIFKDIKKRRIPNNNQMTLVKIKNENSQILAHTPVMYDLATGYPTAIMNNFGKGRILYFNFLPGLMNHTVGQIMSTIYGNDPYEIVDDSIAEYEKIIANTMKWAIKNNELVKFDPHIKGLVVHLKKSTINDNYYLHLIASPKSKLSDDKIHIDESLAPPFKLNVDSNRIMNFGNPHNHPEYWDPKLEYTKISALKIDIKKSITFNNAELTTLDKTGEFKLNVKDNGNYKTIFIPKESFKRYSIITLF